tara:strand:- start:173 stop:553 length:381 start_codon:yes stop_codon:yes gene_type:complete
MKVLDKLKYTKEHEWIDAKDSRSAVIGITDFAQGELGDVVFVELPNVGDVFDKDDVFGTVEAVKTVADLYIPVSGKVVEINEDLESNPELINSNPYEDGWIIKIELSNLSEINDLLTKEDYEGLIK